MSEAIGDKLTRHATRYAFRQNTNIAPDAPLVTFTFDDIPASAALTGAPALEARDLRGSFYVAGGLIGQPSDYGEVCATAEDLKRLVAHGHDIACHTYAHQTAKTYTPASLVADLDRNAQTLQDLTGCGPLESFAFPLNAPTLSAKRQVKGRYRAIRSGCPGVNRGRCDLIQLKGVSLEAGPVAGLTAEQWITEAVKQCGWLIFFTHDVRDDHSVYGTTPAVLEKAIDDALKAGCRVLTTSRALDACGIPQLAAGMTSNEEAL